MEKLKFIIIDRLTRARDNGEYFYRYLKENHPEIDILYGLSNESSDWDRLKKEGFNLINLMDSKEVQKNVSDCTHFLFSESNEGYNKIVSFLNKNKVIFIYLNHGCFFAKDNVCYPVRKFDYMICGNNREYNSVIFNANKRGWNTEKYLLTGLPRMDEQVNKYKKYGRKNLLVIQPWWRNNLTGWHIVESTNKLSDDNLNKLLNSDFVKGYNELLNNPEFKSICEENKLKVVFKRHPVMENIPGVFNVPNWITDEPEECFVEIFARTKIYVTDYSSNAFETANLDIPCIYFEPDYENLVYGCNRPEWAWNVKNDGLGPVAFDVKSFLTELKKLINNEYILDEVYKERRKQQISFIKDNNNCERCFNAIIHAKKINKSYDRASKITIIPAKPTVKVKPKDITPFTGLSDEWWKEDLL